MAIFSSSGWSLTGGTGNRIRNNVLTECDRPLVIPPKWLKANTVTDNRVPALEPKSQ